jgi:hypothetical protein
MSVPIAIGEILAHRAPAAHVGREIGRSRQGRPIIGYNIGEGPFHISLIAGCHADEPVGPAMLERLVSHLLAQDDNAPVKSRLRWWIVPHANPDGDARNAAWSGAVDDGASFDLYAYIRQSIREAPGDDVEFGFPRHAADSGARPENQAIASFLDPGGPFVLHASFHGMAYAAGPWFLMESSWADRTTGMRERLRRRVAAMDYRVHDIDRQGEKGFTRIDEGFTTRPDSVAMASYFRQLNDEATASLFRPSSMEYVRSLGGDPLTLVSEMPLFVVPAELFQRGELIRPPELVRLRDAGDEAELRQVAEEVGVRPMPIGDQMRLQLAFLEEALATVLREL